MPSPSEFYKFLLEQINDEDEKKVFEIFTRKINQRISREQLLQDVYGIIITARDYLNMDGHDRMIRRYIERLRLKGFPIIATSGDAGYTLVDDPEKMDAYIAEEGARIVHIQNKIDMLYKAKKNARILHEWREATQMAIQTRMF